jgi:hypothetical protein
MLSLSTWPVHEAYLEEQARQFRVGNFPLPCLTTQSAMKIKMPQLHHRGQQQQPMCLQINY